MAKEKFINHKFNQKSLERIEQINSVIDSYLKMDYTLTLRQLYYQLVSKGFIENSQQSYDNTGKLVNNARLAGLIDWRAIEDRTRNLKGYWGWQKPSSTILSAAYSYRVDKWQGQPNYVEVWVEKEALAAIIQKACSPLRVPFFSCRGYTSQSEMYDAAKRFIRENFREGRYIIHLGDHDPSGIDMTRDIQERLNLFGAKVEVKRIALTMEQINQFQPPPNFAKEKDSRFKEYAEKYGDKSWELDALEPQIIENLINKEVIALRDDSIYKERCKYEEEGRQDLQLLYQHYDSAISYLKMEQAEFS